MSRFFVLLIDSEIKERKQLAEWIQNEGFEVHLAAHGLEALSLLSKLDSNPSEVPRVLILSAMLMPVMNGYELISFLKMGTGSMKNWKKIPVIAYGDPDEPLLQDLQKLDKTVLVLKKPLHRETLFMGIHQLMSNYLKTL